MQFDGMMSILTNGRIYMANQQLNSKKWLKSCSRCSIEEPLLAMSKFI